MLNFLLPRRLIRFLRPGHYLRRRAVYGGLFGGSRKWLILGGLAWFYHWIDRLLTGGDPTPRYTRDLGAGERVFVIHEPISPHEEKVQAKRAAKEERRAAKDQRKAAKRAR